MINIKKTFYSIVVIFNFLLIFIIVNTTQPTQQSSYEDKILKLKKDLKQQQQDITKIKNNNKENLKIKQQFEKKLLNIESLELYVKGIACPYADINKDECVFNIRRSGNYINLGTLNIQIKNKTKKAIFLFWIKHKNKATNFYKIKDIDSNTSNIQIEIYKEIL